MWLEWPCLCPGFCRSSVAHVAPSPSPCGVRFWVALSCVGYFCTEHLGVQVILGLIPSLLDLFFFENSDPAALFPLFISPVLSPREHWDWGVPLAPWLGWGCRELVLDFVQRWLSLVLFLLP